MWAPRTQGRHPQEKLVRTASKARSLYGRVIHLKHLKRASNGATSASLADHNLPFWPPEGHPRFETPKAPLAEGLAASKVHKNFQIGQVLSSRTADRLTRRGRVRPKPSSEVLASGLLDPLSELAASDVPDLNLHTNNLRFRSHSQSAPWEVDSTVALQTWRRTKDAVHRRFCGSLRLAANS